MTGGHDNEIRMAEGQKESTSSQSVERYYLQVMRIFCERLSRGCYISFFIISYVRCSFLFLL